MTINDIRSATKSGVPSVCDCMSERLIAITPGQNLEEALDLMIGNDINLPPVVDPESRNTMLGYITTTDQAHPGDRINTVVSFCREKIP